MKRNLSKDSLNKNWADIFIDVEQYGDFIEHSLTDKEDISYLHLETLLIKCDFFDDLFRNPQQDQQSMALTDDDTYLRLARPHGRDSLKPYQIDEVIQLMKERSNDQ